MIKVGQTVIVIGNEYHGAFKVGSQVIVSRVYMEFEHEDKADVIGELYKGCKMRQVYKLTDLKPIYKYSNEEIV
jgi:hypothetical protein